MVFQILDDKERCFGIYRNGEFIYDRVPHNVTGTWSWHPNLSDSAISFADIYTGGQSIDEVCPEHLKTRFDKREQKIKAFIKSAVKSKINIDDYCLFNIVPEQHLRHYCEVKNEICEWVFEHYERPDNHDFIVDLKNMSAEISRRPVLIDQERLLRHSHNDMKAKSLRNFLSGQNKPILYDVWGSRTGRLATKTGSFPIMNLKKEMADVVIPKNNIFVQFDLNGAEIRTLLSLSTGTHPREDVHEYNIKNVYRGIGTREKAKKRFFAWLYNPNAQDHLTERFYNKTKVLKKFYSRGEVYTPFGRKIQTDDFHALNYLLQSTSSDNCMMQCVKINKFLKHTNSFVHSVIHDSLTIDLDLKDRHLLPQIQEIFEDTQLGWFKSSTHVGHNLKDMLEVSWS